MKGILSEALLFMSMGLHPHHGSAATVAPGGLQALQVHRPPTGARRASSPRLSSPCRSGCTPTTSPPHQWRQVDCTRHWFIGLPLGMEGILSEALLFTSVRAASSLGAPACTQESFVSSPYARYGEQPVVPTLHAYVGCTRPLSTRSGCSGALAASSGWAAGMCYETSCLGHMPGVEGSPVEPYLSMPMWAAQPPPHTRTHTYRQRQPHRPTTSTYRRLAKAGGDDVRKHRRSCRD